MNGESPDVAFDGDLILIVRLFVDRDGMSATVPTFRNAVSATKIQGVLIHMLPPHAIRSRKRFRLLPLGPVFLKLR